jgi:DNA-binding protein YbaB
VEELEVLLVLQPQEPHRLQEVQAQQERLVRTLQTHTLLVQSEAEGGLVELEMLGRLELPESVELAEQVEQLFV